MDIGLTAALVLVGYQLMPFTLNNSAVEVTIYHIMIKCCC